MGKRKLEVGDRIWIETRYYGHLSVMETTSINEYEIIEANSASAYAVKVDELGNKPYRYTSRIDQRKMSMQKEMMNFGILKKIWPSREAYDQHIAFEEKRRNLRAEISEKIKSASIEQMERALKVLGG